MEKVGNKNKSYKVKSNVEIKRDNTRSEEFTIETRVKASLRSALLPCLMVYLTFPLIL